MPFESEGARALNRDIFETMYFAAMTASCELAEREGAYETFQGSPVSKGIFQFDMWGEVRFLDGLLSSGRSACVQRPQYRPVLLGCARLLCACRVVPCFLSSFFRRPSPGRLSRLWRRCAHGRRRLLACLTRGRQGRFSRETFLPDRELASCAA